MQSAVTQHAHPPGGAGEEGRAWGGSVGKVTLSSSQARFCFDK